MNTDPPTRYIEIEGYKLPQYEIHLKNGLGEFFLYPVLPTNQYIKKHWDEYKNTSLATKSLIPWIEIRIEESARTISIPKFSQLFTKNKFLTKEGGTDSYSEFVKARIIQMQSVIKKSKGELNTVDKLQLSFQTPNMKSLSEVYESTIKTVDIKDAGTERELEYLAFLDSAMRNFEIMLKRNIKNLLGLYEIRFFNILYRKQPLFANRILAYDLPRFFKAEDLELDMTLTSLLVLGWGFELNGKHFKKTSTEIQSLAERFFKLYLLALKSKTEYLRMDEAEKKRAQRQMVEEINFSDMEFEDDEGNIIHDEKLLIDKTPSALEQVTETSDLKSILNELPPRLQDIAKMIADGERPVEIARKLGVSKPAISKAMKQLRSKLKK